MHRSMLKNSRNPESFSGSHMGCSCCNPKRTRRKGKKAARRREEREWRKDQGA